MAPNQVTAATYTASVDDWATPVSLRETQATGAPAKNMTMDHPDEDLSPRPYQSQVLDIACRRNTIVFLPTGSGKTFIAVMHIKRVAFSTYEEFSRGGKRTFFLVNTVALAEQQRKYIERHTCLSVGHFTGDMNVDFWNERKWLGEMNKYQVLVMTAQIFLNILNHGYLQLSSINLLILDECHHAVNEHCMNEIMKHFTHADEETLPRVMGLTATLLNSSVKVHRVLDTAYALEKSLRSKIACVDNLTDIESFSSSPEERIITFDAPLHLDALSEITIHIQKLSTFVQNYAFEEDAIMAPEIQGAVLHKSKSLGKKIANKLAEVWSHIESLGGYGGSISVLKLILFTERMRARANFPDTMMVFAAVTTTLTMIRTLLEREMMGVTEGRRILQFSSPQVVTLLESLKKYHQVDGRTIIFVQTRLMAQVLFHILRAASENLDELRPIKPDFVVGFQNNPFKYTREGQLEKKWNMQALERFHKGEVNTLVASSVLEEGIDIPLCKLVVKYDAPISYRSYIQSKGRARHKDSAYLVLIPNVNKDSLYEKIIQYKQTENSLKMILTGNRSPSPMWQTELSCRNYEHIQYVVGEGARVNYSCAISLVNRYCSCLPQDSFTKLIAYWYFIGDGLDPPFQCILQLPINSPLRDAFQGEIMPTKRLAKQSVAFLACKALHQAKELNDHLLPVGHKTDNLIDDTIFSVYHNASLEEKEEKPGTKKCRRIYKKQIPECLVECSPKENSLVYLHVLKMNAAFDKPSVDNKRKWAFYSLLQSGDGFAILTSKKIPLLCDFPVFVNVGKIDVSFEVNYATLQLSRVELVKLRHFNRLLFFDVLKLNKTYFVANLHDEENNYLVVPVKKNELERYEIDWNVVLYKNKIPVFKKPPEEERLGIKECDWTKFKHSLVVPWYRGLPPDQVYVVTTVCLDKCPLTEFPSSSSIAYASYASYFYEKYSEEVRNFSQPLFEVKAVSTRLNRLKPSVDHVTGRRRLLQNGDFEEHLVPELCLAIDFPSSLWVKAICLPSCLHRITHLLLAEELQNEIAADLMLPLMIGEKWQALSIDPVCINEDVERQKHSVSRSKMMYTTCGGLNLKANMWDGDGEPVDIDRERLEDVTMCDILYYDEFINKPPILEKNNFFSFHQNGKCGGVLSVLATNLKELKKFLAIKEVPRISILEKNDGLQLSRVLQALTCASSNDALNMERLETLGDSFLKFATSLFLFLRYPKLDEGKLTQAKGKIVGNKNLFYCGRNKGIAGKIKFHEFNPEGDWIPPGFCIPKEIVDSLLEFELCPSVLFEMIFSREEQESGVLNSSSLSLWQEIVNKSDRKYTPTPTESLMGIQSVPDKNVADCVEALIGAYLQGFGIKTALRLLNWFEILPSHLAHPNFLLGPCMYSPYVSEDGDHEIMRKHLLSDFDVREIESRINYEFKNKGLLLQALTHPSFSRNRLTDCYQRLEYLGDAILDFLVTCYIYEHCGELSPGDLTDLRSALVNNITFGSLAVRYGLHKIFLYESPTLFDKIDAFAQYQQKHGHQIDEGVLLLLDENASDPIIGESVDVPKALGDLFESLAGAIYLDSGKSLSTVWNVYYRLMKKEIDDFSADVPKQPVRVLYECCVTPPQFSAARKIEDSMKVMVELEVFFKDDRKLYYGVGENRKEAKRTAAKIALRDLSKMS